MIHLDGSFGEGGGQILRSALALSLVTHKPFQIDKIRAGRSKPGLLRQHLTAVCAAKEVGQAQAHGAEIGSGQLTFLPQQIAGGQFRFAVGTAGSATLVFQTILPALLAAPAPSQLILEGGTHNPYAPPFDFIHRAFLPVLHKMGATVSLRLERPGFYPAGGGRFAAEITPVQQWQTIALVERGATIRHTARALVSRLPTTIAQRELSALRKTLNLGEECCHIEEVKHAMGPGNVVLIELEHVHATELFTGFGERRTRSETVAARAAKQVSRYLAAGVPVGPYLADQLLVPMAIAGAGRFRTLPPSPHTLTNIEVIKQFLDVNISIQPLATDAVEIEIRSR